MGWMEDVAALGVRHLSSTLKPMTASVLGGTGDAVSSDLIW
jgi:hypothetical protein